ALLAFAGAEIPHQILKFLVAGLLFAQGLYRTVRYWHPRGAGMRAGFRDLTVWSFLMALAHGAGLMLVPVLLTRSTQAMHHSMHASPAVATTGPLLLGLVVLVHTLSLLLVAGILALVFYQFYERFGLALLRRAWFNFDLLWAVALLVAGVVALVS